MAVRKLVSAGLVGAALALGAAGAAPADTLRVMNGSAASALQVPMNRAVVVESDRPFAELSIANPGIADISTLSDRSIYVLGKTPGRTTLTLLGPDGMLITNVEVHVTPDIAEFRERLQQILPGEPIEVRTANDGIVLSGTVSSIAKLDRALDLAERYAPGRVSNLMSVGGTQQVMLKVRFAEVQRSVTKALSSSFAVGGTLLGGDLGIAGGTGVLGNAENFDAVFDGDVATSPVSPNEREGVLTLGWNSGSLQFAVLLEALEARGLVRTLAEPNLTALSGQQASFLAGGEYPVPVAQDDNTVTIEFKPFGIELAFVPRVVDNNLINLELSAAVSSLDPSVSFQQEGLVIAGFRRRDASTTVEMRDGESFAIAGLLQDDFQNMTGQVPWLGDIPVLGALFRSAEFQRNQSELVIIITAHLVTPTRGEALALPTDRVRPPTETDLFLFGRTVGAAPLTGAAGEVARQGFSGSYGYVME